MGVYYVGGGGGGALLFLLLFFGMFVLVPVLFFRGATRSVRVLQPGGWPVEPGYGDPGLVRQSQPRPVDPADVESVVARLAADVRTLNPGQDAVSRQAMADASERYATASSLLERAQSQDQLRTGWVAAAEGLHATRLVRQRLGLDAGPAPTLPPVQGPQLDRRSRVLVDGREHVGAPTYEPGYGHWFPGGRVGDRYVPGGWYTEPFWPGSLVLSAVSGFALGSLLSGAMLGGLGGDGYDGGGYDGGWGDGGGDGGWGGGGWGDSGGAGGWGAGDGGWGGDMGGGGDFGGGGDW